MENTATVLNGRIIDHAIVFGLPVKSKKLVQNNWPFGFIYIGSVSSDSINYVCSYVQKKLYGKDVYPDVLPPFSVCSRGLGLTYAIENKDAISNADYLVYRGKPISIPRYFTKKLNLTKYNSFIKLNDLSERLGFDTKYIIGHDPYMLAPIIYNSPQVLGGLKQLNRRLKASMRGKNA